MVRVRGQKLEQEHGQMDNRENVQKIVGDDAAGITLLVPDVKTSRLQNGIRIRLGVLGLPPQVAHKMILADHMNISNRSCDLA